MKDIIKSIKEHTTQEQYKELTLLFYEAVFSLCLYVVENTKEIQKNNNLETLKNEEIK